MTGLELKNTLTALGCPDSICDDELYLYLVNTSLRRIYNDVVILERGSVFAHGIKPISYIKEKHHAVGEDITIPVIGKAYSFRVCGDRAEVLIGAGSTTIKHEFTNTPTVYKDFTVNNMTIVSLVGDFDFMIFDFCIYDNIISLDREDIPEGGETTSYDVTRKYKGFSTFMSYPTDASGAIIEDAEAVGNKIKVKSGYRGEIFFTYRKKPIPCEEFGDNYEIDIPNDYEMLLPLLFMAYLYLDLDEDKAEIYMSAYKDMLKTIYASNSYKYQPETETEAPETEVKPSNPSHDSDYSIVDGWT